MKIRQTRRGGRRAHIQAVISEVEAGAEYLDSLSQLAQTLEQREPGVPVDKQIVIAGIRSLQRGARLPTLKPSERDLQAARRLHDDAQAMIAEARRALRAVSDIVAGLQSGDVRVTPNSPAARAAQDLEQYVVSSEIAQMGQVGFAFDEDEDA